MNPRLFFVRTSRFACPLLLAMSVMGCGVPPQLWEGQWASLGSIQPLGALRTCFGYCLGRLWFQHWWQTGAMNT